MKRSELAFTALLVPVDALMLFLAFLFAYQLRNRGLFISPEVIGSLSTRLQFTSLSSIRPLNEYLHYVAYLVPAMVIIFGLTGLYDVRPPSRFWSRFARVILGVSSGLFFILLLFLFKRDFFLPRTTVLYSWVLGIILVTAGRFLVQLIQRAFYRFGIGAVRVAVLGNTELANTLAQRLSKNGNAQYIAVELPGESDLENVLKSISRNYLEELVVVSDKYSTDDLTRLRNRCLEEHVGFGFVPRAFLALQGAAYQIRDDVGLPMIQVRPTPLDGWGRIYKRGFDIVMSSVLIIICSPLYLLIGLIQGVALKGTSKIFTHKRMGRGGLPIVISKYRSMKPGWTDEKGKLSVNFLNYLKENPEAAKEWEETAKLKDDPRIGRVGQILRATRLDELPQFFDVLRGDLSLVGPRPIVDWEVEKFGEQARILFHVRPGITGPWQVAGGNSLSYDDRVRLNTHYIEHWNPWIDLVILTKTAWLVLAGVLRKVFGIKSKDEAY